MADKYVVRKSGIQGKGIFCTKKILKGETICFLEGEEISIDEMSRRVDDDEEEGSDPLLIGDDTYLDLEEVPRTFNHSCEPSAFIRGKNELVALKDIEKGDEITFDYSTTMNDNKKRIEELNGILWTCKCNCKSKNCRRVIDQFRKLPAQRREYYLKNKLVPDHILKCFSK